MRLLPKDRASILVTMNGDRYLAWEGDRKALAPDRAWSLSNRASLGVGAYNARVVFHDCRLKRIGP